MKRVFLAAVLAIFLILPLQAQAADVGIGYIVQSEGVEHAGDIENANWTQGISLRTWSDNLGLEAAFMFMEDGDLDGYLVRGLYALAGDTRYKVYGGGTIIDVEPNGSLLSHDELNALAIGPTVGIEFMPFVNVGISLDASWLFVPEGDREAVDAELEDLNLAFGVRCYF